jgi:hypothetical protein
MTPGSPEEETGYRLLRPLGPQAPPPGVSSQQPPSKRPSRHRPSVDSREPVPPVQQAFEEFEKDDEVYQLGDFVVLEDSREGCTSPIARITSISLNAESQGLLEIQSFSTPFVLSSLRLKNKRLSFDAQKVCAQGRHVGAQTQL